MSHVTIVAQSRVYRLYELELPYHVPGFAVGIAIRDVIDSIALDSRRVLPISSVQNGCYGIRDVALSVPTVVGRAGVVATHEIDLWPKEVQGIRQSGATLRQTIETVLSGVGGG